jgi:probable HAF family extracellular repeat protein
MDDYRGCLWDTSGQHFLPYHGRQPIARGINDNGEVAGSAMVEVPGVADRHAFVWTNGSAVDLSLTPASVSEALSINNRGELVGYSTSPTGDIACYWQPLPEPSSFAGAVCGLAGLLLFRRRRP